MKNKDLLDLPFADVGNNYIGHASLHKAFISDPV